MDKPELTNKVLSALEDNRYKWHTPKGVAEQIGVPEAKFFQ